MFKISDTNSNRVHLIGIGGIGMSALARWFKSQGFKASGSDADGESIIAKQLRQDGIKVLTGHHGKNIPRGTALVIRSQAIDRANSELQAAIKNNIPVFSYPETLGFISQEYKTIAIAGAHGKSTTTALTALTLIKGNLDPTVIIGTTLKEFKNSNFRKGASPLLVLEADEYGKAFLYYSPLVTIVTNIDREHLDIYFSLKEIQKTFLAFLSHTTRGGTLVLNRDDRNLWPLSKRIKKIAEKNQLKVFWYSTKNKEAKLIKSKLQIAGIHNVSNALAAFTVATKVFKVPQKIALSALGAYKGAWRRMEYRGKWQIANNKGQITKTKNSGHSLRAIRSLLVYDDYAHHPTEIHATLAAFKEKFPDSPLICVFEPHQALRLEKLFKEFSASFENADAVLLLPTYQVRGRDQVNPRFTSETLAKAIQKKYPKKPILYLSNPTKLKEYLVKLLLATRYSLLARHRSAVLIMMGAGSIVRLTDTLLKK
ncbi:MAG: UDP-N-acetylmuramate--L-alanine ligase [Candidatus Liptonbacteria bacterium]|nr:UDP-N-acetylmuramate--L-alanine ligase [Candidatus Liptonbacteria bacterium]